ncbi:Abi family protein [Arachnia propionica]|uniref:Abi family protein n=1 Tax=Arachnia propionica TaxID=1750 RepID=A0A3P1T4W6_9ACTN|nr:Abi family protein [Arachnia propionica]RRD04419.1 Abi family protein [Arachnia propionica]
MEYTKPWLSYDQQVDLLVQRGVEVSDREVAKRVLQNVGYYRLSGYLFPFREDPLGETGHEEGRSPERYREGTNMVQVVALLDFDRRLRLLVLEAVERIEVALRAKVGYFLGGRDPFVYEDPSIFTEAFLKPEYKEGRGVVTSQHYDWLGKVGLCRERSKEDFIGHFRDKYENRIPIWVLTEVLELGHLSSLCKGLRNDLATQISVSLGAPTKKFLISWIACMNHVRNIAAHHARLFNRGLVTAPKRPSPDEIPLLAHLRSDQAPKKFGSYSALAVMAYLLREVDSEGDWAKRVVKHLSQFPSGNGLEVRSMGIADGWLEERLWQG